MTLKYWDSYPLNSSKGSSFEFDDVKSSTNIPDNLKKESGNSAANAYTHFFSTYVSTSMSVNGTPFADDNEVTFSYSVRLNTLVPLEAVSYGYNQWDNEIWKLFGGKDNVQNAKRESRN